MYRTELTLIKYRGRHAHLAFRLMDLEIEKDDEKTK